MRVCSAVALAVITFAGGGALAAAPDSTLTTLGERTAYERTGRYAEVENLCHAWAARWRDAVRCFEFGRSPEGRAMWALAVSTDGALEPKMARDRARPVVLLQGGIHAGEIDGKDAGFLALREMLESRTGREQLARVTVVFVPVFNVDGHERFGAWNRPNQRGPAEMGWRTTAQNLNLNRDYVKAEAPEMRAMLALLDEWDPLVMADLHVTDGADFEHDISITSAAVHGGDEALRSTARDLLQGILAKLRDRGSLPLDFYPSLLREDDPASGFAVSVAPPRFSDSYWATRNRLGVLVETHSWKPYAQRVRATRATIDSIVELVAKHGAAWHEQVLVADARSAHLDGARVPLAWRSTDHVTQIDFRGYAYRREPSAISGAMAVTYDPRRPQIWRVPLFDQLEPSVEIAAPKSGYVVPAAWAALVGERLKIHGIAFSALDSEIAAADVATYRAVEVHGDAKSSEGRVPLHVKGEWRPERRVVPKGSLFVPIAQTRARLVMAILEPEAPDSLVSWGYFDAAFEQREYMEPYVAEQVARDMLARDPGLREEFAKRLSSDAAFAANPQARLDFFYRRHPSWDERFNLYPVYRADRDLRTTN